MATSFFLTRHFCRPHPVPLTQVPLGALPASVSVCFFWCQGRGQQPAQSCKYACTLHRPLSSPLLRKPILQWEGLVSPFQVRSLKASNYTSVGCLLRGGHRRAPGVGIGVLPQTEEWMCIQTGSHVHSPGKRAEHRLRVRPCSGRLERSGEQGACPPN